MWSILALGAGEITAIVTSCVPVIAAAICSIIAASRNNDRKKGRTKCSITGCELKPKKSKKHKKNENEKKVEKVEKSD